MAMPFFGIATELLPVFARKPLFGYKGMVGATMGIAGLSMTVWAHHMSPPARCCCRYGPAGARPVLMCG